MKQWPVLEHKSILLPLVTDGTDAGEVRKQTENSKELVKQNEK